jgi:hypothetical protein
MASSTASAEGQGGPLRFFSGETEDTKEYRRWKVCARNKFLTLDKLSSTAKGAYIYTLLSGKALECIWSRPSIKGEDILWNLLDQRFPQKDKTDELGDALGKVSLLRSNDGETLKAWIARATEVFDSGERRAQVKFPVEPVAGYCYIELSYQKKLSWLELRAP